jgi:hypothetical protein
VRKPGGELTERVGIDVFLSQRLGKFGHGEIMRSLSLEDAFN